MTQTLLTSRNGSDLREYPVSEQKTLKDKVFDYGLGPRIIVYGYILNRNDSFRNKFYNWGTQRIVPIGARVMKNWCWGACLYSNFSRLQARPRRPVPKLWTTKLAKKGTSRKILECFGFESSWDEAGSNLSAPEKLRPRQHKSKKKEAA